MQTTRKISYFRVLVALIVVAGTAYATSLCVATWQDQQQQEEIVVHDPWFASYVDVTSTPTYSFEQLGATETHDVLLSFIVASNEEPCVPTWGTYYTMDEASAALDLDRRIARLQQQGGNISVSFGGAINSELAHACEDENKLYDAYKSVIDRYGIDTVDLDIEGENLTDTESNTKRARVMARLQNDYREHEKNLAVWLTLPVSPRGLTPDGTTIVSQMIGNGVDLAGVNVMTMDYGESKENRSMLESSTDALKETHRQLGVIYQQSGVTLGTKTLWSKVGATPMIGQNDVIDEVFTLEDAQQLNGFAHNNGVGRMSMWSANRDQRCGENYVDVKVVSDSCHGVDEEKGKYTLALSKDYTGTMTESAGIVTVHDPESAAPAVDDPETSPYQIWNETGAYPKGTKVVWHSYVYEAKWWTKKDLPDNPVLQAWETPWQLIGPVLPGEKLVKQPTLPAGTYPQWDGKKIYRGGEHILFEETAFYAKWWNQGESPAKAAANPDSSPWMPLTQAQIVDVLEELGINAETSK